MRCGDNRGEGEGAAGVEGVENGFGMLNEKRFFKINFKNSF